MAHPSVYWEDVEPGQELPEITYELSLARLVAFVRATGLYDYVHFDRDYARASGARDVFISAPHIAGLFSRLLTDWAGPESSIRSLTFSIKTQCCANDLLRITGKVGRKYISAQGDHAVDLVDLNIGHRLAPSADTAVATIALPSKVAGPASVSQSPASRPQIELDPDLPEFARPLLGEVKESAADPACKITSEEVHLWCESLEDWNPLYWDRDYADRSRYGGTIVPPTGTFYGIGRAAPLGIGYLKPGGRIPPAVQQGLTGLALQQALREQFLASSTPFSLPGYPEAAVVSSRTDFYAPLRPGDYTSMRQEMLNCSGRKRTRLGEGYFLMWSNSIHNQHDELIAVTQLNGLFYRA